MKKKAILFTCMLMVMVVACTGCVSASSYLSSIDTKKYSNTAETAISQTDIKLMVEKYMQTGTVETGVRKSLVIMVDSFRANTIESFYDYGKGIARLANSGGLYFTKPANIETKSRIGRGTNMLSIMTGVEPSEMNVLKSSDVKRAEPLSLAATCAAKYPTGFYSDYANYIDHQLAQEFAVISNINGFSASAVDTIHKLRDDLIKAMDNKSVILSATSELYKQANGDYSTKNVDYMNAIINFNSYIEEMIQNTINRDGEDWLIVVTSTFGGEEGIMENKKAHNTTTFLASNKKIVDGCFV